MAYKRGRLQEERYRLLESIGFEWNQLDSKWMKEFHALKNFFDMHGRWPRREDGTLATWSYTQRERRKKGCLSKERIRFLDGIGFIWNQDLHEEWMKNYEALNCSLTGIDAFRNRQKETWRVVLHPTENAQAGKISPDRQVLLDQIGFVWSVEQV